MKRFFYVSIGALLSLHALNPMCRGLVAKKLTRYVSTIGSAVPRHRALFRSEREAETRYLYFPVMFM